MTTLPFLIFDAYGTLVELDDFYGRLRRGFAQHGANLPLEVVEQAARAEMTFYIERSVLARDHASWLRLRRDCAAVLAEEVRAQEHPLDVPNEHLVQILGDAIRFRAFDETRDVLEALHAWHIPMGVLSNWDYELPQIFDRMQLGKYFSFVLSSAEIGVPKPQPQAFAAALELARKVRPELAPRDCFYIGDHYEKDIVPALAADFRALWLVRDERDYASGGATLRDVADESTFDRTAPRLRTLHDVLRFVE